MANGFEDVRDAIAEALRDDSQYQTFSWPPTSPTPNSVALEPADPWITQLALSKTMMSNWVVKMYGPSAENHNDLVTLENIVITVLTNIPGHFIFSEVSAPTTLELNNTLITVCDLNISVPINIEE